MSNFKSITFYSFLGLICIVLISCATIMHGTGQEVGFNSNPSGALVTIDNKEIGNTPVIANLKRGQNHVVAIQLDGYEIFEANIVKSTSGWVWGNIVFGGLIGLGVDAITGGLYKLKPDQVDASLISLKSGETFSDSDIVIAVVLKPDPNWQKIGNLKTAK